ncbi:MAG TPA: hypothetical protein VM030_11640, partial [Acidimicrobiales bacterium]|nr:hypothetical protein [Acidimicrobiales bacterium]
MGPVRFDTRGVASLDGQWEFFPGDHPRAGLDGLDALTIRVPGLWEAQGHLELDGVAWYRTRFDLDDLDGEWTLCFGAVMDLAEVYLNGTLLGSHELPFTPFELPATAALVAGTNVLDVRVTDPPLGDPEHARLPHGKQGWMNHVFPSRPSLYMTYGGIWQPVILRRHGPLAVGGVFVNGDPDDLVVEVEVTNRSAARQDGVVGVRALGRVYDVEVDVPASGSAQVKVPFGAVTADRWSPQSPVVHEALVDVRAGTRSSDVALARFGLRTVRVEGRDIVVNGVPYRMKSVLVQGFTADELYAEGSDDDITAEIEAALAMGFNTLRLHIKAFDPRYLDACDRLGVFVHCDLPVAEPVNHEEMGADTVLGRRCVAAITEQVRRD